MSIAITKDLIFCNTIAEHCVNGTLVIVLALVAIAKNGHFFFITDAYVIAKQLSVNGT